MKTQVLSRSYGKRVKFGVLALMLCMVTPLIPSGGRACCVEAAEALRDTVYPYSTTLLENGFTNYSMKRFVYNGLDDEAEAYMSVSLEVKPDYVSRMLFSFQLSELDDISDVLFDQLLDIPETVNKGDSLYLLDNTSVSLMLSNGETLSTKDALLQYEDVQPGEDDALMVLFLGLPDDYLSVVLLLAFDSDRADLSSLSPVERHAYCVSRLGQYDIKSITLLGQKFNAGNFHTAATLRAMFADAEKVTGMPEMYHYAPQPVREQKPSAKLEEVVAPDEMPVFPGGPVAMMQYISANLRYPKTAQEQGVQGRVIVQFIVEADGSISETRVMRSVSPEIDAEALRLVHSMPRWTPGKLRGEPVRVRYILPVSFRLQ